MTSTSLHAGSSRGHLPHCPCSIQSRPHSIITCMTMHIKAVCSKHSYSDSEHPQQHDSACRQQLGQYWQCNRSPQIPQLLQQVPCSLQGRIEKQPLPCQEKKLLQDVPCKFLMIHADMMDKHPARQMFAACVAPVEDSRSRFCGDHKQRSKSGRVFC